MRLACFFDQPTEGSQPLRSLSKRDALSLALVEQDLDFISSLADRVLVIGKGQLAEALDPAALSDSAIAGAFVALGAQFSIGSQNPARTDDHAHYYSRHPRQARL
jgi:ABC-type glutathione transport system ATPase component